MTLESTGETTEGSSTESSEVTNSTENVTEGASKVTETPEYVPNFKFKVQGEEKEFDEFVRGAIKDKASEDKLRDIYSRADGFETYKKNQENWKEKVENHYQPQEQKFQQLTQNINKLGSILEKRDYQTFFDTLKIPKQDILKYALDLVKYDELPADQKAMLDQKRQMEQQTENLQIQNQSSQEQVQQYAVQVRTMQLNNELMNPNVSALVQNFDVKAGKAGAFRELVINHANMAYYRNNVDMPVEQAVKEVMQLYGNLVAPQTSQNSSTTIPQAQQRPPIIPNVQGSGNSPAKKTFKSLDEIRAHAKTINE